MNKTTATLLASALAAGLAFASLTASAAEMKKEECLACHGSLEALASLPAKFETDSGKVNPHKYVPHGSKEMKDFPECVTCHTPHAMPPQKGFKDQSANIDYCYTCHHNYNFQPCKECHK